MLTPTLDGLPVVFNFIKVYPDGTCEIDRAWFVSDDRELTDGEMIRLNRENRDSIESFTRGAECLVRE